MDVHAGVMMKRLLTLQGYTVGQSITDDLQWLAQGIAFIRRGFAEGFLSPVIWHIFR